MIKVTLSQIQLDFFNSNGFVNIFGLYRKKPSLKEIVNVYSNDKFITKAERHYLDQFRIFLSLRAYGALPLVSYIENSGFKTAQGLYEFLVRDKPNAHTNDLWVVYRLEQIIST